MRIRELYEYKNFKLIEEREDDGDRYYYYNYVLKDDKYCDEKVDIGYNFLDLDRFKKLVDLGFPTRVEANKCGPLTVDDIEELWQKHINNVADKILLGEDCGRTS